MCESFVAILDLGRESDLLTSSSVPPHGSVSLLLGGEASGESARRRAVRRASRWRRRFVRWRSVVSSGVRKKVSSASEGRSDHPPLGESGLGLDADASSLGAALLLAMRGSASRRRRASYLCGLACRVSGDMVLWCTRRRCGKENTENA